MDAYEQKALNELRLWQRKILKRPSLGSRISKGMQNKVNNLIPDRIHSVVTEAVKNMVKVVLVGSEFVTKKPLTFGSLQEREMLIAEKLDHYKKAGVVSGAGTGAGGLLLGLADFPILLTIKIKFLFDIASIYGFDVSNYKERLYILHVFQLAFSSPVKVLEVYRHILDWDNYAKSLPLELNSFDWRTFQQEYRDYIDVAKVLQLVPGIGAVVGAYANYKLIDKLGETAINAYRLRVLNQNTL